MISQNPQLRFPEFEGEWDIRKLVDLTENGFSNGVFNDPQKVGRGYRIINVKDMYVGDSIDVETLTLVDIDEKEFKNNKVEYGDIFFTRSSLVKEGIAHTNVNISKAEDITYDGHLIRMRPIKKISSPQFLAYNFTTSKSRLQFVKRGKTTTMTTIGQNDIATVTISFPSLPEQEKIAGFLSVVDEKLQALKKKKELLEQYKKSLMQKIFSREIRFKDEHGEDFPDWEEKKLGDILSIPNKTRPKIIDKTKILTVKLHLKGIHINERTESLSLGSTNYFVRHKDQFIYGKQNLFNGAFGIIPDEYDGFLSSGDVPTLNIDKTKINSSYLYYFLGRKNYYKELESIASGTGSKRIHEKELFKLKIKLPTTIEQNKIIGLLSIIDKKITNCQAQIDQMETWKKGLLQKMFV